jgi:hypothetical protein
MKPSIAVTLFLALSGGAFAQERPAPPPPDPAREARLSWFREAKYGLFIHWGLYAIPAGEWKGRAVPGIGEWIMNRAKIPVREYEALAGRWNLVKFDAEAWVRLAEDTGRSWPRPAAGAESASASTTRRPRTGTTRTGPATPGTSARTRRRTLTASCARRRSRRCASS